MTKRVTFQFDDALGYQLQAVGSAVELNCFRDSLDRWMVSIAQPYPQSW